MHDHAGCRFPYQPRWRAQARPRHQWGLWRWWGLQPRYQPGPGLGTPSQGNPGGTGFFPAFAGGGGGGFSQPGFPAIPLTGGKGGDGFLFPATGTYYAGGGGGGAGGTLVPGAVGGAGGLGGGGSGGAAAAAPPPGPPGSPGASNTGGGGGGGGPLARGGDGGSGIVIVVFQQPVATCPPEDGWGGKPLALSLTHVSAKCDWPVMGACGVHLIHAASQRPVITFFLLHLRVMTFMTILNSHHLHVALK
jgi:hypothetical protein